MDTPGKVIDRVVNGVAPDLAAVCAAAFCQVPCPVIRFALHASADPVTTAVGYPAEILHIHVKHLAGRRVLIPAGMVPAVNSRPRGRGPQRRAQVAVKIR